MPCESSFFFPRLTDLRFSLVTYMSWITAVLASEFAAAVPVTRADDGGMRCALSTSRAWFRDLLCVG